MIHYSETGTLQIGGWHDSSPLEGLNSGGLSGTDGYFALLDDVIFLPAKSSSLGLFAQFGSVQNNLAEPRRHLGAGVVWHIRAHRSADNQTYVIVHRVAQRLPRY